MERRERWENWVMFLLGIIAGLVAIAVVELSGINRALYEGFEVETEQVANE